MSLIAHQMEGWTVYCKPWPLTKGSGVLYWISFRKNLCFLKPSFFKIPKFTDFQTFQSHASIHAADGKCRWNHQVQFPELQKVGNCLGVKLFPYCWRKKSCTSWDVKSVANNGINYLSLNWWSADFWTINSIKRWLKLIPKRKITLDFSLLWWEPILM